MNSTTQVDDTHDFFEKLVRRQADTKHSSPTRTLHDLVGNDDLDDFFIKQNSRHFYGKTVKQQLTDSFYVGRILDGFAMTETTIEHRMGTDHISEPSNEYNVYEREAIVDKLENNHGRLEYVITRSKAGFEVLNTSAMMVVDIDFDLESGVPVEAQTASSVAKITGWAHRENWSIRIYRTHSGLRLITTHLAYESVDESFDAVCAAVAADAMFQELCHVQSCFRARLTPKPKRCGLISPECFFPFNNAEEEEYFAAWLEAYSAESAQYGTCRYITTVGNEIILPRLLPLVTLHDDSTKAHSGLPIR